jgi:hypothetical protein
MSILGGRNDRWTEGPVANQIDDRVGEPFGS